MSSTRRVMVSYKVKAGHDEENEALVHAVYRELAELRPDGFRYATFKLEDGLTFIHLASVEAEGGQSPLPGVNAFREFQSALRERCDELPVVTELREVGSFRLFGDEK
ncbi:MAG: hypothetical protein QOD66_3786 [Solirubrobacteraceae bacterium]|nr:hypothetical protein [Solirubrobacteraceae bacterium]